MNAVVTDPVTLVYHELRSPLGLLATAARSAAMESEDAVVRSRCDLIARAAERMLRTAGRIIDLASASAATGSEEFDAVATTRGVVDDYREMGVTINYLECAQPRGGVMTATPGHLEALISSLLGNAIDHGDPGSPLDVRAEVAGDALHISISNRRAATQRHRGLGLGAYICGKLAAEAGAELDVESGAGSFSATLRMPLHGKASGDRSAQDVA